MASPRDASLRARETTAMRKLVQTLRFASTFVRLVRDTGRLDLVFALADSLDDAEKLAPLLARPEVAAFLARQAPPFRADLPALRRLPDGTLGGAFARFLDDRGFDATGLYHSDVAGEAEILRIKSHLERTHDLWHTLLGFDTDVAGELGLQAFMVAQFGSPLSLVILAAGLLNTTLLAPGDAARRMEAISRGWQLGRRVRPLFGADWPALLARPLSEVRAQFGVDEVDVRAAAMAA